MIALKTEQFFVNLVSSEHASLHTKDTTFIQSQALEVNSSLMKVTVSIDIRRLSGDFQLYEHHSIRVELLLFNEL